MLKVTSSNLFIKEDVVNAIGPVKAFDRNSKSPNSLFSNLPEVAFKVTFFKVKLSISFWKFSFTFIGHNAGTGSMIV